MKYRNVYNNLIYWIDGDDVLFGSTDNPKKSGFVVAHIEEMVKCGSMIPLSEGDDFKSRVIAAKDDNPVYNLRFLAFVEDKGSKAWGGNVAQRNAHFMAWIADRKADYKAKYPYYIVGDTIGDQDHFTNFIISGEWR